MIANKAVMSYQLIKSLLFIINPLTLLINPAPVLILHKATCQPHREASSLKRFINTFASAARGRGSWAGEVRRAATGVVTRAQPTLVKMTVG